MVHPRKQHQGIARQLMDAAELHALALDLERFVWTRLRTTPGRFGCMSISAIATPVASCCARDFFAASKSDYAERDGSRHLTAGARERSNLPAPTSFLQSCDSAILQFPLVGLLSPNAELVSARALERRRQTDVAMIAFVAAAVTAVVAVDWALLRFVRQPFPKHRSAIARFRSRQTATHLRKRARRVIRRSTPAWYGSYHRTYDASRDAGNRGSRNFDNVRVTDVNARPMLLERRGRELWADFDEPDWDGKRAAPPRIQRRVVMTTGSHHQQIYWYATGHGRLLGQLPAIRLIGEERWIPRKAAVMHPPGIELISESGSWNAICVQCHTTLGKPEFSTPFGTDALFSQSIDTRAVEFGISCEMCHGPPTITRASTRARFAVTRCTSKAAPIQPSSSQFVSIHGDRRKCADSVTASGSFTIRKANVKQIPEDCRIVPATS
jgi:hypothetical protein